MESLRNKTYRALRKSESFFKTDMVYLAQGGSWLGIGQAASACIAFISSIFFANLVSKDLYGSYKFIIAATSILASLSLTGMGSVVTQGVARGAEGVLKSAVKTTLHWGFIIIFVSIGISAYYFLNKNFTLGFAMLIAGASLPLIQAFTLYGNFLMGKKDFKRVTLYAATSQLLNTTVLIIIAITTQNIVAMIASYFAVNTLATVIAYRRTLKIFNINKLNDRTLITYGKHLSVMGAFGTIANQLDKVLIFHYLGAVQLAVYAFAQAIPDQLKGVLKNIFGVALPKYAALKESELRSRIIKKSVQLTLFTAIAVIIFILTAPFIFKLLFPKYTEAVLYSQIYMLGLITIPGISLFAIYFQLKKATKIMYKLNIISNSITLIITFLLIYMYGLLGAVSANGLSWLIMLLIHLYYFSKDKRARNKTTTV